MLRLPLVLLPGVGTLLYLLLNSWVDGDPFAFVTHQEHWYQGYLWIDVYKRQVRAAAQNPSGDYAEPAAGDD